MGNIAALELISLTHVGGLEFDRSLAGTLSGFPNLESIENDFRIGVKKIENGKMSTFLNEQLKEGDELELMSPAGNFVINEENNKFCIYHYRYNYIRCRN